MKLVKTGHKYVSDNLVKMESGHVYKWCAEDKPQIGGNVLSFYDWHPTRQAKVEQWRSEGFRFFKTRDTNPLTGVVIDDAYFAVKAGVVYEIA